MRTCATASTISTTSIPPIPPTRPSRITAPRGFKGSAEHDGIVAFGGYERWLDADTQFGVDLARQAYAGVKTEYGMLQFGTFGTGCAAGKTTHRLRAVIAHPPLPTRVQAQPAIAVWHVGPFGYGFKNNVIHLITSRMF